MSIIEDGFEYGVRNNLKGFCLRFSNEELQILKTLKTRQEKKFKSHKKLIPYPLFQFFWDIDYLPIMERPAEGMRVPAFIELLSHGDYRDKRHEYKGIWLRDRIEAEIYPLKNRTAERYIGKTDTGKLWPESHLRDLPGTMIK